MNLLEILVGKKVITEKQADAFRVKAQGSSRALTSLLVEAGISEEAILAAKAEHFNIPSREVGSQDIPFELLKYVPEESASHYEFVPIGIEAGILEVGILDPDNIEARDALNFISSKVNLPYKLFLISERDFDRIIQVYKSLSGEVTKALSELEQEAANVTPLKGGGDGITKEGIEGEAGVAAKITEDAPVTKIVATIIRYAIECNDSDIHIEHTGEKIRVRFRVDGELHTSLTLPTNVHSAVVARIKILTNMKLDEKRKPQDGRFSARIEGREVDFRVSTFPAYYGEKVVMRILDKEKGIHKLEDLGLSARDLDMIRRAIARPYGMIVISGPTGSGKSTTLYSMLNEVDRESKNVLSLEDPVEYNMEGVSQSQVRPEIDYTFANGLRTTLRQDPDVIMVGEIRDRETAALTVQAALTGHLVFTTLHTNDAVGIIPRLIDMGVDPYLIAPTLVLGIAQRLVRKLCPNGGRAIPIEGSRKKWIEERFADLPEEVRKNAPTSGNLYELMTSAECPNGTRGRLAVFEMFEMDKDIEQTILKSPTELDVSKVVRGKGMLKMQEDAIVKCSQRLIPFEEVNSLT